MLNDNNKCKLTIKDEVNIKFDGLDPVTRRKMHESLKFEVPGARFMPAVKLGRWDGKTTLCTMGASSYINGLDVLLPIVTDAGYEIEIVDLRNPFNPLFKIIDKQLFGDKTWQDGHELEGQQIILRDYQVDCIKEYIENIQCVQEISTGSGKTILSAALSYLVEDATGGRTLLIVPNKDLVEQTAIDYKNVGLDVGVYYGDKKDIGNQHTICTWQSLTNIYKMGTIDGLNIIEAFIENVNCVIVDECLHSDTMIMTDNGYVKICNINVGDNVMTLNEDSGIFEYNKINKVYVNMTNSSNEDMYEIEIDNNITIKITGNHKVLTNNGWIQVKNLMIDDNIIDYNNAELCNVTLDYN